MLPTLIVPLVFLPICIVVPSSVNLLVIAKRVARREKAGINRQGIITVVLTAALFCVSWLPVLALTAPILWIESEEYAETVSDTHLTAFFTRAAQSFTYLNITSNFYIYCLTLTSFRNFIRSKLQRFFRMIIYPTCRG